jgi:hypothetical protein
MLKEWKLRVVERPSYQILLKDIKDSGYSGTGSIWC